MRIARPDNSDFAVEPRCAPGEANDQVRLRCRTGGSSLMSLCADGQRPRNDWDAIPRHRPGTEFINVLWPRVS